MVQQNKNNWQKTFNYITIHYETNQNALDQLSLSQIMNGKKESSANYSKIANLLYSYGSQNTNHDYIQIINTGSKPIVIDMR